MPKKLGDRTPSQNIINLLVYLLENDRFHTLSELAEKFEISKPTVIRSLERQDLTFFGKLIKEKLGKEVAYRLDKSNLLHRLMRIAPKSDAYTKNISKENFLINKKGKYIKNNIREEIFKQKIKEKLSDEPLLLTVLSYMELI